MWDELERRIADRQVRGVVVGQGYVGLSVAAAVATAGMDVVGIDTDADRVRRLAAGDLVVPGVRADHYTAAMDTGRLTFAASAEPVAQADIVVICVPTPVRDHQPDLSAISAAGAAVAAQLTRGTLVILESTTYPGTTEQVLQPLLEARGLRAGTDFLLAYSPERIDPGNQQYSFADIPRVVGGTDPAATAAAVCFYSQLVDKVHPVTSTRAAELAKLLENTYRMVNIALVNELTMVCADQGIDTWEVIEAAATKPFGFAPFYPGPGVGGHCIPIDPTYLSWQSRRDTGRPYRLVELAQDINAEMPRYVVTRIAEALNDHGKALKGSTILALGVTYKPDVGDIRESAPVQVLRRLAAKGVTLRYHDPFVDQIAEPPLNRARLDAGAFKDVDCVALLTPHTEYDIDDLIARSALLFDARNATAGRRDRNIVVL